MNSGLVDVLAEALQPLAAKIQRAFVYGSIASGEARMDSDIDQALALRGLQRSAGVHVDLMSGR